MTPFLISLTLLLCRAGDGRPFGLVIEAESMKLEGGWKPVKVAHGNLVADQTGLGLISGERVALLPPDQSGAATAKAMVPAPGDHVLWLRREHAEGCDAPLVVRVSQRGKTFRFVAGRRLNPVFGPGDTVAGIRRETAHGTDALVEERFTLGGLEAGEVELTLEGEAFEGLPGTASPRSVDALVLTADTRDSWRARHSRQAPQYPILEWIRELAGARWEARFRHQGDSLASFSASHQFTRAPLGAVEGILARDLEPGRWSAWSPLSGQDTCHPGVTLFNGPEAGFDVEIRPAGSVEGARAAFRGKRTARVFLPPYAGVGEAPSQPEQAIRKIFEALESAPAPGRVPSAQLCLGEHIPAWAEGEYGERYAELQARLLGGPDAANNIKAAVAALRSGARAAHPDQVIAAGPEAAQATTIARIRQDLRRQGLADATAWYELGENLTPVAWLQPLLEEEAARDKAAGRKGTPAKALNRLWIDWLEANRGKVANRDYWMGAWGNFDRLQMRPDSSSAAAATAPRLYVDSLLFYEEMAARQARLAASRVRLELGRDTHVGITVALEPFHVPTVSGMTSLARSGAIDFIRPGDGFWRSAQAGPLANGYASEFAAMGLRGQKSAVIRPFNLAQEPGNTDADFIRSAISQLAHGATRLDFGGLGLNETVGGNHVDYRSPGRFRAVRDVAHAVGLVEDLLPSSRPVASPVGILVSESTDRWDLAEIMRDGGEPSWTGPGFGGARLCHHLDRLGLYAALAHQGRSPDLFLEADCTPERLKGLKLLFVVGDCLPGELAARLEGWVREGGVVLATAGAGRFDPYRKPQAAFDALLGLKARISTIQDAFALPRRGLASLNPIDTIAGPGWLMPVIGAIDAMEPAENTLVVARFQGDDRPAVCARELGKGRVLTIAALPGMSCLWTACQPAGVPDRGPSSHRLPAAYDPASMALVGEALKAAGVTAEVLVEGRLADSRVLDAGKGFVVPVANYGKPVEGRVEISLRLSREVSRAVSAWAGPVPLEKRGDSRVITLPGLAAGDILRLE